MKTVKKHCETRWSSYYNAVDVIQENFDEIISCLEHFKGGKFSSETKSDAYLLLHSLQQFSIVSFLKFWCPILSSVQRVTKRLQDPKINLIHVMILMGSIELLTRNLKTLLRMRSDRHQNTVRSEMYPWQESGEGK